MLRVVFRCFEGIWVDVVFFSKLGNVVGGVGVEEKIEGLEFLEYRFLRDIYEGWVRGLDFGVWY